MATKSFKQQVREVFGTKTSGYKKVDSTMVDMLLQLSKGGRLHYFEWKSNGRSAKNQYLKFSCALAQLGLTDYVFGNDAPKGGKNGDYIELVEKSEAKRKRNKSAFAIKVEYHNWVFVD